MGYVLMRALGMRFCNTSHLNFGHNSSFQKRARDCALFLMRKANSYTDIPGELFS
jgi:hypothetical protein